MTKTLICRIGLAVLLTHGLLMQSGSQAWAADDSIILEGHDGPVFSTCFSPDGKLIATCGQDGTIRLWDAKTGTQKTVLKSPKDIITNVAFAKDGKVLLGSCGRTREQNSPSTIKIWDLGKAEVCRSIEFKEFVQFAVSPDGKTLATCCIANNWDGDVKLWSVETAKEIATMPGPGKPTEQPVFSPDGKWVATTCMDRTVRIWDVGTHKEAGCSEKLLERSLWLAFSPSGESLASSGEGNDIRLLNVPKAETLTDLETNARCMVYAKNGKKLIIATKQSIVLLDVRLNEVVKVFYEVHKDTIMSLVLSPDGKRIASAGLDGTCRIWNMPEDK